MKVEYFIVVDSGGDRPPLLNVIDEKYVFYIKIKRNNLSCV